MQIGKAHNNGFGRYREYLEDVSSSLLLLASFSLVCCFSSSIRPCRLQYSSSFPSAISRDLICIYSFVSLLCPRSCCVCFYSVIAQHLAPLHTSVAQVVPLSELQLSGEVAPGVFGGRGPSRGRTEMRNMRGNGRKFEGNVNQTQREY